MDFIHNIVLNPIHLCTSLLHAYSPGQIILIYSCWRDLSALLNVSVMLSLRLHLQLSQHAKYLNLPTTSRSLESKNHWKGTWLGCCPNTRILGIFHVDQEVQAGIGAGNLWDLVICLAHRKTEQCHQQRGGRRNLELWDLTCNWGNWCAQGGHL